MTPTDLLRAVPGVLIVELTTRCNLRCAYCASSQPGVRHHDLEMEPAELVEHLRGLHPRDVQLNGHGETTVIRGWHRTARALWDAGYPISLTTNLARPLDPDEVEVLSLMERVTVSCDTADAELLRRIRGGTRLEVLERNLFALAELCSGRDRQKPYVCLNAVVSDLTLGGLPELVRWAARRPVDGVSLVNLVSYEAPAGLDLRARHPAEVDPAEGRRVIEETRAVAQRLGIDLNVMPGLAERLSSSSP